jgi:hypothetical protein
MTVNVVGFKYRGTTPSILQGADGSQLSLRPEPSNPIDYNAIKLIVSGRHVAYIQKDLAAQVSALLRQGLNYTISIKNISETFATLVIEFGSLKATSTSTTNNAIASSPGIYEIIFSYEGQKWSYYGQSSNMNKRIKQHQRDLENAAHHNSILQNAWIGNPNTFQYISREVVGADDTPLIRQIKLFKMELSYISTSKYNCANILKGDLVLSADAQKDLKETQKYFSGVIAKIIGELKLIKDAIGEIMLRERLVYSFGKKLNKSNVLSQIKMRHSYDEPSAFTDSENPLFKALKFALQVNQNKIEKHQNFRKIINEFPSKPWNATKYTTTSFEEVTQFLSLIERYQNFEPFAGLDRRTSSTSAIKYDPILESVLSSEVISMLRRGIPKKDNASVGQIEQKLPPQKGSVFSRLFGR